MISPIFLLYIFVLLPLGCGVIGIIFRQIVIRVLAPMLSRKGHWLFSFSYPGALLFLSLSAGPMPSILGLLATLVLVNIVLASLFSERKTLNRMRAILAAVFVLTLIASTQLTFILNYGSLILIAVGALCSWQATIYLGRYYQGIPISRISSAAQGFTLITGTVQMHEQLLQAGLSEQTCVWYRFSSTTYNTESNKNVLIPEFKSGERGAPFLIDDGSGHCHIDPSDVTFHISQKILWYEGILSPGRFSEEIIIPGDTLYAYGNFLTGDGYISPDVQREANQLVKRWDQHRPAVLRRFDLDNNGLIDEQERQLMFSAALREIKSKYQAIRKAMPITHRLTKTQGKQRCLVTDLSQEAIGQLCQKLAIAHLGIFVLTLLKLAGVATLFFFNI